MEKIISKLYYDPEIGFSRPGTLYKKMLKLGYEDVTLKQITEFIKNQNTDQLNKIYKKPGKNTNSISARDIRTCYQMDILVYDRFEYHSYKYILVVIDVYSRYAACKALTNRSMKTICEASKEIFEEMGIPKNLNTDNEFNKKEFNQYCDKNNIKRYYSQPDEQNKNALAERLNYTIARRLNIWREGSKDRDWPKILPKIILNYNNTEHSKIHAIPSEIWAGRAFPLQNIKKIENIFKIGDRVRHVIRKEVFDKNDKLKFSKNIEHISNILGNKIYLDGITKYFKPYELMKVEKSENKPEIENEKTDQIIDKHDIDELKIERINKKSKQLVKKELGEMSNIIPATEKRVRNLPVRYRF